MEESFERIADDSGLGASSVKGVPSSNRQRFIRNVPGWLRLSRIQTALRPSRADLHVLSQIDHRSEQIAAVARLVVIVIVSGVIASVVGSDLRIERYLIACLAGNGAISVIAVAVTHRRRPTVWLSWISGLLDVAILVGVVLGIMRQQAELPDCYVPVRVATWGVLLTFGLSALRGRPFLLAVQTVLFMLALLMFEEPSPGAVLLLSDLPHLFATACGPGENAIRISVVCLAGSMFVVASVRARVTLFEAIAMAREASRLSRYFDTSVASIVVNTELAALREGRHQNVAILFADLRGFTEMTEMLPPRDIAAFLTKFRNLAAKAIEGEGGVIDKFIGDEVMGLFGAPTPSSTDAERAINAAAKLMATIATWSAERVAEGFPPIQAGIGVHYGPAFAGVLGRGRLEFTVLGSTVNAARRLEQMTKDLNENCIVSAWAVRAARAQQSKLWICRGLGAHAIRGQSGVLSLFALRLRRSSPARS